jgi:hypothetical protein
VNEGSWLNILLKRDYLLLKDILIQSKQYAAVRAK